MSLHVRHGSGVSKKPQIRLGGDEEEEQFHLFEDLENLNGSGPLVR